MRRTLGTCTATCVLAIAGFATIGVAGFSSMSSLGIGSCLISCDGEKTTTKVVNKEAAAEKKECCDLAKLAKGDCSESKVTNVAAKESGESAKTCSKTEKVAAENAGESVKQCPAEAVKIATVAFEAANASGCCKAKSEAKVALIQAKLVEAEYSVAQAANNGCCKTKAAAEAKLVAVRAEAKEAGVCVKTRCSEAEVTNVAAKESGESAKTCSKTEKADFVLAGECRKAQPVAAKESGESAKTCSKTEKVAAENAGESVKQCPAEAVKIAAVAFEAANASGCCKAKSEAKVALIQAKLVEAEYSVAQAANNGCCKTKAAAEAKLVAVRAEAKEAGVCVKARCSEAKVENAANAEKKDCSKACNKAQAAATGAKNDAVIGGKNPVVIPAAFVPKGCCSQGKKVEAAADKADEGCCKGSGKRADGKPCCGNCDTTEAKSPATTGEPLASR